MRIELQKRPEHSKLFSLFSPILAIGLTLVFGGILFELNGVNSMTGLYLYFIDPLTSTWSLEELVVKATPLILIGCGLSICFLSNNWNIGAEGQFTFGAIFGSFIPIIFHQWQNFLTLPSMLILGVLGGMFWASIPALLKTRFNTNEVLTSLMLVYVSTLVLDWLVRGPWRDPDGFNFPESRIFSDAAILPSLADGRMHFGAIFALIVVFSLIFLMTKSIKGFEIRVIGFSPRAGRFAGFSEKKIVWFAFLISGGLAGLAGVGEVSGTIGQLTPVISPGYGFVAIIVAFLGRLNPIGVLFAGFLLALSYLGGESIQVSLGVSDKITRVFQGALLFFVLACDTLILYKIRIVLKSKRLIGLK